MFTLPTDIPECTAGRHNCTGNAICVEAVGYFRCACPVNYQIDEDTYATCKGIALLYYISHSVRTTFTSSLLTTDRHPLCVSYHAHISPTIRRDVFIIIQDSLSELPAAVYTITLCCLP